MSLAGDLLSLLVSLVQEAGVVLGVGAVTITLVGHLLALHARQNEFIHGYVRASRQARAVALGLIILSGGVAILIHLQSGTAATLFAPAFLFKWLLIALLASFYFMEWSAKGAWQDAVEGFEGANWYALFIVHSMAPVLGWALMLKVYAGWIVAFGVAWAGFVWLMRRQSTLPDTSTPTPAPQPKPIPPAPMPKPMPKPVQPPQPLKPVTPPAPKPVLPPLPKPIASPPPPQPVPKPVPPPVPVPPAPKPVAPPPIPPQAPKKVETVPNHSNLPMIGELELPAPFVSSLPPITVMPKRPEDMK